MRSLWRRFAGITLALVLISCQIQLVPSPHQRGAIAIRVLVGGSSTATQARLLLGNAQELTLSLAPRDGGEAMVKTFAISLDSTVVEASFPQVPWGEYLLSAQATRAGQVLYQGSANLSVTPNAAASNVVASTLNLIPTPQNSDTFETLPFDAATSSELVLEPTSTKTWAIDSASLSDYQFALEADSASDIAGLQWYLQKSSGEEIDLAEHRWGAHPMMVAPQMSGEAGFLTLFNSSATSSITLSIRAFSHWKAAANPGFSLASGSYSVDQAVVLSSGTPGASIYYTLDGSIPNTESALYDPTHPLILRGTTQGPDVTTTVKAVAVRKGALASGVSTLVITIQYPNPTSVGKTEIVAPAIGLAADKSTVPRGGIITFTVNAASGYQWFLDGIKDGAATNLSYALTVSGSATVGYHTMTALVKDSNGSWYSQSLQFLVTK